MILDIKALVAEIKEDLKKEISTMQNPPKLSVVLVWENPASISYVNSKEKTARELGMETDTIRLSENISEDFLIQTIQKLSASDEVDGILVQFPLPPHINKYRIIHEIAPEKDVDGFTSKSIEWLFYGTHDLKSIGCIPCTPKGIIRIIERFSTIAGSNITIIGHGNLVGKPLSILLSNLGATVTVCNKQTKDLASHTKNADIVVVAAWVVWLVQKDMIRENALVIDVGINRNENGKLCGDCITEEIAGIANITPVPGGVGIMTVAMLMENVLETARKRR